nr:uncharacterized protein LOC109159918 [Ipomoea batatas]
MLVTLSFYSSIADKKAPKPRRKRQGLHRSGGVQGEIHVVARGNPFSCRRKFTCREWKYVRSSPHLQDVSTQRSTDKWVKLGSGTLKLNIDASAHQNAFHVGMGWIFRDHQGYFFAAQVATRPGPLHPWEAEALAVREALSWLKDNQWEDVVVETDAEILVHHLHKPSFSPFGTPYRLKCSTPTHYAASPKFSQSRSRLLRRKLDAQRRMVRDAIDGCGCAGRQGLQPTAIVAAAVADGYGWAAETLRSAY